MYKKYPVKKSFNLQVNPFLNNIIRIESSQYFAGVRLFFLSFWGESVKNESFKYFGTNKIHYLIHILIGIQGKNYIFCN